jgi:hypothetical protein
MMKVILICLALIVLSQAFEFPTFKDIRAHKAELKSRKINNNDNNYNYYNKRDTMDTCTKLSCATRGQSCAFNTVTNTEIYCTQEDLFCSNDGGAGAVCSTTLVDGSSCLNSNECQSTYCNSTDVCQAIVNTENGATCTQNDGCDSSLCTNNVCVGRSYNETCAYDGQCASGLFCTSLGYSQNRRFCENIAAANSACDITSTEGNSCVLGYTCQPRKNNNINNNNNNTNNYTFICVGEFSGGVGTFCDDSVGCGDNLACLLPATGETYGQCGTAAQSTKKNCNSDSDCTTTSLNASEECSCNTITGNQVCINTIRNNVKGNKEANDIANECLNGPCKGDTSDDCPLIKCKKNLCKFADVSRATFGELLDGLYPECYLKYIVSRYDQICSASILSSASVIFFAFLGVAVLLF